MRVDVRLRDCLQRLYRGKETPRGIVGEIARGANIHRHTVAAILRSGTGNVSLKTVEALCTWLRAQGYSGDLPGDLIAARPSSLWDAIARTGAAGIILGEYLLGAPDVPARRWVHRRDAGAAFSIIQHLSNPQVIASSERPRIEMLFVPVHRESEGAESCRDRDIRQARQCLKEMRDKSPRALIFFGSQLVNYAVEHLVAELFDGCEPFREPREKVVPIYMSYRKDTPDVPSCLAGRNPPIVKGKRPTAGMYYRKDDDKWDVIEWKDQEQDAGVVLTSYEAGNGHLELAIFGFSGRGTEAMGECFAKDPDPFWPGDEFHPKPASRRRSRAGQRLSHKRIQISVCRIAHRGSNGSEPEERVDAYGCDIVQRYRL